MQIGRALTRVPEVGKADSAAIQASIVVQYDAFHKIFGEYTDEVILYALAQYKGIGPNTAELISDYMLSIQAGGDPFRRIRGRRDAATDRDQVESATTEPSTWSTFKSFFTGESNDAAPADAGDPQPAPPVETPVDNELVQRAMSAIGSLDELTPAEEAVLVSRYGKVNVDKAKSQLGQ